MGKLSKNKLYAILIVMLGLLSIPIDNDITFFVFGLIVAIGLFVTTKDVF